MNLAPMKSYLRKNGVALLMLVASVAALAWYARHQLRYSLSIPYQLLQVILGHIG